MPIEKLKNALVELEAELANADQLDSETEQLLKTAAVDIQKVLDDNNAEESHDSLIEQLHETAVTFETTHPNVAGIVRKMVNALGQLGI